MSIRAFQIQWQCLRRAWHLHPRQPTSRLAFHFKKWCSLRSLPTGSNSEAKLSFPPCNDCRVHLSNLAWLSSCLASLALRRLTLNLGMSIWQLQLSSLHVTTATHAWIVQGFYGTVACRVGLQKLSQNIYWSTVQARCLPRKLPQVILPMRTQAETATLRENFAYQAPPRRATQIHNV